MSQGLLGMLARGRLTGSPNQISTVQKRWALQKKSRFCLLRKGSMSVEREEKQQSRNLWILKTPLAVLLPSLLSFSGVSVTSSCPCVRVSKARYLCPQVLDFSHVSPWISVRVGQCICTFWVTFRSSWIKLFYPLLTHLCWKKHPWSSPYDEIFHSFHISWSSLPKLMLLLKTN